MGESGWKITTNVIVLKIRTIEAKGEKREYTRSVLKSSDAEVQPKNVTMFGHLVILYNQMSKHMKSCAKFRGI